MKYLLVVIITLAFLQSALANQEAQPCQGGVYFIKDIGETAYFLVEKLRECGILARTVIINAKKPEILFDNTTALFVHNPKTRRAYELSVAPLMCGKSPGSSALWLMLVDPKKCAYVYITSYDGQGNFIDLRPYLFPVSCE
ncbi:MAG: hypothetical protein P4L16_03920 [Chlamydiales bacterium]|nr:hypothetical protein [Chlamydiales bacterium]